MRKSVIILPRTEIQFTNITQPITLLKTNHSFPPISLMMPFKKVEMKGGVVERKATQTQGFPPFCFHNRTWTFFFFDWRFNLCRKNKTKLNEWKLLRVLIAEVFARFHESFHIFFQVMVPCDGHPLELFTLLLHVAPHHCGKRWSSDPKSWYCILLTLSVSITNAFMVVYPQLCFLTGQSGTRRTSGGWDGMGLGGWGGNLCRLVMSKFPTNSDAALSNLKSLMESGANQRGGRVGSPASWFQQIEM